MMMSNLVGGVAVVGLLVLLMLLSPSEAKFPPGFAFGTATASYQVEGAVREGGRGSSIWDDFAHTPNKVYGNQTGDVADDHYHRFEQDIQLMATLGVRHYRMSIAWPRIIPDGDGEVSQEGVAFYTRLFQTLQQHNLEPFVTLYHWDLPSALVQKYEGWLDPTYEKVPDAFAKYARACFANFGKYVKHWLTFNEPLTFVVIGYQVGTHAPGRCSDRRICPQGNSSTEPYVAGHNVLLAHAKAVQVYRDQFQKDQGGKIGMTTSCDWQEPLDPSQQSDRDAAQRTLEWECGWWNDPIFFGDYPATMKDRLGARLPTFTAAQSALIKGSHDFLGLNHYTSRYATAASECPPSPSPPQPSWNQEACVVSVSDRNGVAIGQAAASDWLLVVPWGIRRIVNWVWQRYNSPIFITENGVDEANADPASPNLDDRWRIDFYDQYLSNVSAAIDDGSDVRGYFAWSFMDNFEWADGYSKRFGLVFVDYLTLQRTPKASAKWYSDFIRQNSN